MLWDPLSHAEVAVEMEKGPGIPSVGRALSAERDQWGSPQLQSPLASITWRARLLEHRPAPSESFRMELSIITNHTVYYNLHASYFFIIESVLFNRLLILYFLVLE